MEELSLLAGLDRATRSESLTPKLMRLFPCVIWENFKHLALLSRIISVTPFKAASTSTLKVVGG